MGKLRVLKGAFKVWNREVFRDVKRKKQEILGRIKALDDLKERRGLEESLKEKRLSFKMEYAEVVNK